MRFTFPFFTAALLFTTVAPLKAQVPDSTRRDSTRRAPPRRDSAVVEIAPIEVVGSIAPVAGPTIGSGIPARLTTVTGAEIDAWEPRTLANALSSQTGISTYDDVGSPYKPTLSTRGFTVGPVLGLPQGVSVFLDGVRQNEPDAAEVNFDLLPLEHIKRIELLSGTGSLLGPNSLGGAVNLITKRGEGPLTGELEVSGGSYGAASGEGSISGRNSRGWDFYLGGGYEREDGWRPVTGAEDYNGFLNLGHTGKRSGVRLQAFGARSAASTAGSLPESIFNVAPKTNFTPGDIDRLDQQQVAISGYRVFAASRASFTVYHRRSAADRFNVNQVPDPDVRALSNNHTTGANADWRWGGLAGKLPLSVRVGFDGAVNRVHVQILNDSAGNSVTTTLVRSPSWDVAAYSLADLTVGRASFSAGFRFDYVRIPFNDLLDPSADTTSSYTRVSPRGGVNVDLGQGASVYGSIGRSFRAPALLELTCADNNAPCPLPFALGDDPPLKPVIGTTVEAGGKLVRGPFSLDGSIYRTQVDNDIFFVSGNLITGFFTNLRATRREGVELGARLILDGGHSLYASYAYTRATFQSPSTLASARQSAAPSNPFFGPNIVAPGDRIPLVPAHQLRLGGTLVLPAGFQTGLDARYIGSQWFRGDEANETTPLAGYATADVRLAWEGGDWSVSGIVSNLFNNHHAVFGTFNENRVTGEVERFLTPMHPRTIKIIVGRRFGAVSGN
ncbi:MAG: TonB-dependent receptor [Gemmatimonadota bacterium]